MNKHSNLLSHRFGWPTATTTVPIPPGLFQANYGPHGNELIRLEVPMDNSIKGMKGIKVTGDPNVPFDKITFEIETPGCLNIPKEEQASCRSLERFLEEPQYLDFQVVQFSQSQQFNSIPILMQEGLTLDFKMPEDIWENHGINVSSCQVASMHHNMRRKD